jgi:mono/diheme cytochrome c family protein
MILRIGLVAAALAALTVASPALHAGENDVAAKPPAGNSPPSPDAGAADLVAKGKGLYAQHCSHCHGFNMVNPGIIAYDLRQFPHDQQSRFEESVVNGKNGRMPPWGDLLGLEEIDAIWAYVLTGGKS